MKKIIPFLLILMFSVASSSYAFDFIKLGTAHDTDFWGDPDVNFPDFISAVQYLEQRGKNQINPLNTLDVTDENVQSALAGDFGSFDALLFSEQIAPLSEETYALINQYVSSGGCVVVTGSHERDIGLEEPFLNNTFGYNISAPTIDNLIPFQIQIGAAGTAFQAGPGIVVSADASESFSNTPGTTIYSGPEGVIVFTDEFGEGRVVVIGWDYCCTPPDTEGPILDWFEVANRAFEQCNFEEVRPIPTLSEWGLIAMAGVLGIIGLLAIRRRKAAV